MSQLWMQEYVETAVMICFILVIFDIFPRSLSEWHWIGIEFILEVGIAVLAYTAWVAGAR